MRLLVRFGVGFRRGRSGPAWGGCRSVQNWERKRKVPLVRGNSCITPLPCRKRGVGKIA